MNISEVFKEYLEYVDLRAQEQFGTEVDPVETQKNLSKRFLRENSPQWDSQLQKQVQAELLGVGPLENLIHKPDISEILVNAHQEIFYEESGQLKKHTDSFSCEASHQNILERIAHEAGVDINLAKPYGDGEWRGFRLHLIRPPLTQKSWKLSLRRNSRHQWNLEKLKAQAWATDRQIQILKNLIREKENVLVIGATNTGKTTCLNACLQMVGPLERLIFIEDTDELEPPNGVSVKLLTRTNTADNFQCLSQTELLHQSLRMRPDRIVVGEVRGKEAKDYLLALSTGHSGAWCSLHADNPWQALHRLEMLIQMAEPQWQSQTVRQMIHLGLSHIVHLKNESGHRRVEGIHRISSLESTGFCLEQIDTDHYLELSKFN